MRLRSAALTDIGLHRRKNEDRFLCLPEHGLYGVADGIGGLPAGAEAAAQTTETIAALVAAHPLNQPLDMPAIVASANAAVLALARTLSPFYGMGSTLTFCCVRHDLLHLAPRPPAGRPPGRAALTGSGAVARLFPSWAVSSAGRASDF